MTLPLTKEPKVGFAKADLDDLNELKTLFEENEMNRENYPNFEKVADLIKKETIYILTVMGKAIGFTDGVQSFLGLTYQNYQYEVEMVVQRISNQIIKK